MSTTYQHSSLESPNLKAAILEHVLLSCINGISITELLFEMQRTSPLLSNKVLKKYLFYLINYEIVSYNEQRKSYLTEDGGLDLLQMINKEKKTAMVDSEDIVITIEKWLSPKGTNPTVHQFFNVVVPKGIVTVNEYAVSELPSVELRKNKSQASMIKQLTNIDL